MTLGQSIVVEISRGTIEDLIAVYLENIRKVLPNQTIYFTLPLPEVVKLNATIQEEVKYIKL